MPNIIHQSNSHRRFHRPDGVALVVTLSMLAIVALLTIAFVLTARTEVKSANAYNDQAAAKALAKMAVDRALMEIVRQGQGEVISGGETSGGQPMSPSNSYIYIYSTNDFTRIDNWTNDLYLMNNVLTTTIPYGSAPGFDFVELDGQLGRAMIEPYWISVKSTDGVLRGRFAYVGTGGLVDLNAIGNLNIIKKNNGGFQMGFYIRPADTNYGYGYLGSLQTNTGGSLLTYTRGICADISLQKFLLKLGYGVGTVNTSAWCIMAYRYGGWSGGSGFPGAQGFPGGISGQDHNNDGFWNNPSEYTVYPNLPSHNNALTALSPIWTLPIDKATTDPSSTPYWDPSQPIAGVPDPAHTNLAGYASVGPSADPNIFSPAVGARVNLNSMTNGLYSSIMSSNVMALTNVLWKFPQFTNNYNNNLTQVTNKIIQIALNLIDFHTTNRYPSVFTNGINILTGLKPTPYLNQIVISNRVVLMSTLISNNPTTQRAITGLFVNVYTAVAGGIWQPFAPSFPDPCQIILTNVQLRSTAATPLGGTFGSLPSVIVTNQCTNTFLNPITNGFTASPYTNLYYTTVSTNFTWFSNQWQSTPYPPLILTQIVNGVRFNGYTVANNTTNLINQIANGPFTNIVSFTNWPALPMSSTNLFSTTVKCITNAITNIWLSNLEADDPRMSLLYTQSFVSTPLLPVSTNCNLGAMNYMSFPNSSNTYAPAFYPDTGPREGTNSFYIRTNIFLKTAAIMTNAYISIGDIGYVHRGEPWATIRLWPYQSLALPATFYPYGDGGLLDYFRVSDLVDVAGRINLNVGLNGPQFTGCVNGGINQSPALHALFSGITNPAYSSSPFPANSIDGIGDGSSDSKITAIIQELGTYRASLTNSVVGGTMAAINGTNGAFTLIGQLCAITNLTTTTTDLGPAYSAAPAAFSSPPSIPYTNDANREALIRSVANLVTTWQGGGTAQIIGWGQVIKGGSTNKTDGVAGAVVKILATFQNVGGKIRITSYQYIP